MQWAVSAAKRLGYLSTKNGQREVSFPACSDYGEVSTGTANSLRALKYCLVKRAYPDPLDAELADPCVPVDSCEAWVLIRNAVPLTAG